MNKNIKRIKEITQKLKLVDPKNLDNINNSIVQIEKELESIISFQKNKNFSKSKIKKINLLNKLQVGGGSRLLDEYINLDIFPPADIIWDVRSGLPFEDNKFKEIFCEHFFEHLDYPKSAHYFLSEAFRILKIGGVLKIVVPDGGTPLMQYARKNKSFFKKMTQKIYSKRLDSLKINSNIDFINYLFRDQFENEKYTIHWWAYDFENLTKMLKKTGFKIVRKWNFDEKICNPKRKDYSLYLLAKK